MIRKIFILTGYLLLVVFMIITLSFAARKSDNVTCRNIHIEFGENELIQVSKEEIARLVRDADKQLMGKELKQVNADLIEKEVEKHPAVSNAEVFKVIAADSLSYNGILGVRVQHREPVVRIMSAAGKYYLDASGKKIPLSSSYTANVLVATGDFSEEFARRELLPFVLYLNSSLFWKAQIEQVHVENGGDVMLTPLVGDQVIELGSMESFPEKMRNLKAFYEQILAQNNWDKYKSISLKYKNQVIAKKR
ncbi:MAG: cell division protein FtsQ/DivIB [Mariniphaga sp.]